MVLHPPCTLHATIHPPTPPPALTPTLGVPGPPDIASCTLPPFLGLPCPHEPPCATDTLRLRSVTLLDARTTALVVSAARSAAARIGRDLEEDWGWVRGGG